MNWTFCSPIYPDSHQPQTYDSICPDENAYACFWVTPPNPRIHNGLNTKVQVPSDCRYMVKEMCGRAKLTFNKTHHWADQNDPICKQTVLLIY